MEDVSTLWVLLAAALVLLMQAGFLFLEAGLTRAKNYINVSVKNILDFGLAITLFWVVGYGLMFGDSVGGWWGWSDFAQDISSLDPGTAAFWLFQSMFAGTTVTIISGAVAERMEFRAYIMIVFVMAIVYPTYGHWVWSGDGWLAQRGFVDFAGSTVVHSMGGWAALAAIMVVGPRLGRFRPDGTPVEISPSNIPMAIFGTMILWFGWIGFNGGSVLAFDETVPGVVVNTVIGGVSGLFVAFVAGWFRDGYPHALGPLNGALGGLVAVTAGAHVFSTPTALLVGAVGGAVVLAGESFLLKRQLDDAVGAIPVHLGAGIWGTLAVGFFGKADVLGFESRTAQIADQFVGVIAAAVFGFGVVYLALKAIDSISPMRVSEEHETVGLNVAEHHATTELLDLLQSMEEQTRTGKIGEPIKAEPFTEVGQIADLYNRLTDQMRQTAAVASGIATGDLTTDIEVRSDGDVFGHAFRDMVSELNHVVTAIVAAGEDLGISAEELAALAGELDEGVGSQRISMSTGLERAEQLSARMESLATDVRNLTGELDQGFDELGNNLRAATEAAGTALQTSDRTAIEVRDGSERLMAAMEAVAVGSQRVDAVISIIEEVADRTKVLALNATMEASRAGEAGRGFAVVAENVRSLAAESIEALAEIRETITVVRQDTTRASNEASDLMTNLVGMCEQTQTSISAAAEATDREVARVGDFASQLRDVAGSVDRDAAVLRSDTEALESDVGSISGVAEGNEGIVSRLGELSRRLRSAAEDLGRNTARFRTAPV